jgi:hypothetical protein
MLARDYTNQWSGVDEEKSGPNVSELNQVISLATQADSQDRLAVVCSKYS